MSQHASPAGKAAIVTHEGRIRIILTPGNASTCEAVSKELTAGWRRFDASDAPDAQANLDHVTVEEGALLVKISGQPVSGIARLYDILGSLGWECVLNIQQDQLELQGDFVLAHA